MSPDSASQEEPSKESQKALPSWAQDIATLYESSSTSQFILYGNVYDRFLMPGADTARLGSLPEFIQEVLLKRFDVVLSFDLGNSIRIEKGGEVFSTWPYLRSNPELPRAPLLAVDTLSHYFRYCANLSRLDTKIRAETGASKQIQVACFVKDAHLVAPAGNGSSYDTSALILLVRDWGTDNLLTEHALATFLLTENLNDLHPLLVNNPKSAKIKIPLPEADELVRAIKVLQPEFNSALKNYSSCPEIPARQLCGAQLGTIESLLRRKEYRKEEITDKDLAKLKKELVETDCNGLIEFIDSKRSLADVHGQEKVKEWVRQDIALWRQNDLSALPMGYLLCGPVGTGKTFLVECLAGEAGVPVVKIKNFRDRWVGSSEGNLEKIFRLLHALGRCMVFIDEADQSLGKRDAGSGDSGLSGRIYSMIAQEMSNPSNRGLILWVLATSRPDLVEVDLKRPGRVDVKIPLLPTATVEESFELLKMLCHKKQIELLPEHLDKLRERIPLLLTPGAAEALAVKIYRGVKTSNLSVLEVLTVALSDYQPPVDPRVLDFQIRIAVKEASDIQFVPEFFRGKISESI